MLSLALRSTAIAPLLRGHKGAPLRARGCDCTCSLNGERGAHVGSAPSLAGTVAPGEFQVNFTVPQTFALLALGLYHVSITGDGVTSPSTIKSSPPGPAVIPIGH